MRYSVCSDNSPGRPAPKALMRYAPADLHFSHHTLETVGMGVHLRSGCVCSVPKIRSPAIWTYFIISQTTFYKIPTNNPLHAHAFSQTALSYSPFKMQGKPLHLATWYLSINLLQKWKTFLYERIIFVFFLYGILCENIHIYNFYCCQNALLKNPGIPEFFN